MALRGSIYYFNKPMSAYRVGNGGSWSSMMDEGDRQLVNERWQEHFESMKKLYEAFDMESGGRYSKCVKEAIDREGFKAELNKGNLGIVKEEGNQKFVKELPAIQRSLIKLELDHPGLYGILKKAWYLVHR